MHSNMESVTGSYIDLWVSSIEIDGLWHGTSHAVLWTCPVTEVWKHTIWHEFCLPSSYIAQDFLFLVLIFPVPQTFIRCNFSILFELFLFILVCNFCYLILNLSLSQMQMSSKFGISHLISITFTHHHDPKESFPCLVVLLEIFFCYQGS